MILIIFFLVNLFLTNFPKNRDILSIKTPVSVKPAKNSVISFYFLAIGNQDLGVIKK